MSSIQDDNKKTDDRKGKLRLAGPSAVPNAPPSTLIGNKKKTNDASKGSTDKGRAEDVAPGAVAVRDRASSSRGRNKRSGKAKDKKRSPPRVDGVVPDDTNNNDNDEAIKYAAAPSRWRTRRSNNNKKSSGGGSKSSGASGSSSSRERTRRRKETNKNQPRRAPAETSSDDKPGDEMNLIHAEKVTEDADSETLVNERPRQTAVGVAAPAEAQRGEEEEEGDESGNTNGNCRNLPLIILAGVVVVSGAVVGSIALLRGESNAPTTETVPNTQSGSNPPSFDPTTSPIDLTPSSTPSLPSSAPSQHPTLGTTAPTSNPTGSPTSAPTSGPTGSPTSAPTSNPTGSPTAAPTSGPTGAPTTANPLSSPTPVPTSPAPTQAPTRLTRTQKVEAILADYTPWNEQAIIWLRDTDTWEPDDGDPNSDYLWMERYVMADLYFTTNGPNWTRNYNWLSTLPVCNWQFSYSSSSPNQCPGPIKDLGLWFNQLTSSIPSSIGNLTKLTGMLLMANQLTSSIPSSIGNLSQLEYFVLKINKLTSSIPSSIGNLTKLTYLDLETNQLTSTIPSSIRNLSELTSLYLNDNNLTGSIPVLPSSISSCPLENNCFQNIVNGESAGCVLDPNCA